MLRGLYAGLSREGMGISVLFAFNINSSHFSLHKQHTLCNINTDLLTQIIKRTSNSSQESTLETAVVVCRECLAESRKENYFMDILKTMDLPRSGPW